MSSIPALTKEQIMEIAKLREARRMQEKIEPIMGQMGEVEVVNMQ